MTALFPHPDVFIRRCPFCDGADLSTASSVGSFSAVVRIQCMRCKAYGPVAVAVTPKALDREAPPEVRQPYFSAIVDMAEGNAIALWNGL